MDITEQAFLKIKIAPILFRLITTVMQGQE
jgi:hypothetical protein